MPFDSKMLALMGRNGGSGGGNTAWLETEKFSTKVTTEYGNPGFLNTHTNYAFLGTFSDIFGCTRNEFRAKMGIEFYGQYYMTVKYDGVEYTDICNEHDDYIAWFEDRLLYYSGAIENPTFPFCITASYDSQSWENLYIAVTEPGTHIIEIIVGETVKTTCDIHITAELTYDNEGNETVNIKLVKGDFASAKAKLTKGLPMSALVNRTVKDSEVSYNGNSFTLDLGYENWGDGEVVYVNTIGLGYLIYPDNTIELD